MIETKDPLPLKGGGSSFVLVNPLGREVGELFAGLRQFFEQRRGPRRIAMPFMKLAHHLVDGVRANQVQVAYSRSRPEDETGIDYDSEGRVDGALLARARSRQ